MNIISLLNHKIQQKVNNLKEHLHIIRKALSDGYIEKGFFCATASRSYVTKRTRIIMAATAAVNKAIIIELYIESVLFI